MLLGAKQFFQKSAAGWQNPYVTDGLVAMWDGIWNVGGGQEHDGASKIWWDCVGGKPIILMGSSSGFTSNGAGLSAAANFSQMLAGAAPGDGTSFGWRYVEYVVTPAQEITTNTQYAFAIGNRILWFNFSGQNIGATAMADYSWHASSAFSKGDTLSICIDYSSTGTSEAGSAVWLDGSSLEHTGGRDSWTNMIYSPYAIGSFYTTTYVFSGVFHAVRLYNRALSQSERESNHANDVQRFGIS